MEYLVTMTTRVPEGTPEEAVADIRAREAAHSRQLAGRGHLLRLWRPPLRPGEWRTLGLFAADDDARLEEVLASMPLRVWRTDQVTPLSPHPNDPSPAAAGRPGAREFLVHFTLEAAEDTPAQDIASATVAEASCARELAARGYLVRLWRLPGRGRALGLWRAEEPAELAAVLEALPLAPWMTVETTPLGEHPNDPSPSAT
ncbi:muconolactone Delta-isomerase family protein [Streptomyces sp. NPDC001848]|uniref:muconolactone Delta-isomerase family protein n=1 Tax=Streptomyces sp. NPDC001848 TaxID=3364618 RepID=UPI0036950428